MPSLELVFYRSHGSQVRLRGPKPSSFEHFVCDLISTHGCSPECSSQLCIYVVLSNAGSGHQFPYSFLKAIRLNELEPKHNTYPAIFRVESHRVGKRVRRLIVITCECPPYTQFVRDLRIVRVQLSRGS